MAKSTSSPKAPKIEGGAKQLKSAKQLTTAKSNLAKDRALFNHTHKTKGGMHPDTYHAAAKRYSAEAALNRTMGRTRQAVSADRWARENLKEYRRLSK